MPETPKQWLRRVRPAFPDGHLRRVDANGRIVFACTRYGVGRVLAGELVTVRVDGDIVRIFHKTPW